ncbi:Bifunctional nitrilase/nitrile hydratase NIT4A [Diplonema papillatum]|nr:Bifunctional nitrilase/nitrile hydratase NIT4A [Diplonema papillatum]|eukprot:gene1951-2962_t
METIPRSALLLLATLFVSDSSAATVRVASAQIFGLDSDLPGNLVRVENTVKQAAAKGVDVLVFPETILLGWVNPDAWHLALPIPNNRTELLGKLAVEYKMYICIGMAELSADGKNLYDAAILLDRTTGAIIHKHRKINVLTFLMTPPYTAGNTSELSTVAVPEFNATIGILICADTFDSDVLAAMKAKSPDLLLVPYGWAAPTDAWPDHGASLLDTIKAASQIVGCPLVGTDSVGEISNGPNRGQVYGGASVIYDLKKNITAVGRDRDLDVVVYDLEL